MENARLNDELVKLSSSIPNVNDAWEEVMQVVEETLAIAADRKPVQLCAE